MTTSDKFEPSDLELNRIQEEEQEVSSSFEEKDIPVPSFSGDLLVSYISSVRRYPLLSQEDEVRLGRLVQQGDVKARNSMITSNLRLVIKVARDYRTRGVPMLDLIEEGNLGLIHAVNKFDPERGFRFSTYATWWIRQGIEHAVMNQSRLVRLPFHVIKDLNQVLKVKKKLQEKAHGQAVAVKDIAKELDIDEDKVRSMLVVAEGISISDLNVKNKDSEKNVSLLDLLADEKTPTLEEQFGNTEIEKLLRSWIDSLNERQKIIVIHRFGINDNDIKTLEEIGEMLHLTRERVRQLQKTVLISLKKFLKNYGF
ncbi:sigma-70 family RNA polymerase sigma factor [Succinatimonas hippei]|uniref:RNA polymerase sigma factor n=1 Tax=Succinatimonas hippei (strain DSM 22608 / JCM 16073 / KCTC 15190 / YIT 12066) TaxID=762983 RepID=E8LL33_SUCHY|nr:sigma-70 family RNA polymerase sigma factor [Succinatimonas hippei]EFY06758.1 Sigma-70 region 2 [Succinatimonas hippei YIT 12066]